MINRVVPASPHRDTDVTLIKQKQDYCVYPMRNRLQTRLIFCIQFNAVDGVFGNNIRFSRVQLRLIANSFVYARRAFPFLLGMPSTSNRSATKQKTRASPSFHWPTAKPIGQTISTEIFIFEILRRTGRHRQSSGRKFYQHPRERGS